MVTKVNGAAYPGIWVERKVAFIKVTFSARVDVVAAANMFLAGTTTATTTTSAGASAFGIVESAVVQALKLVGSKATILGVSPLGNTGTTMDIMVGHAEGFFANSSNAIVGPDGSTALGAVPVTGAKAVITTAGGNTVVGQIVDINPAVTMTLTFAYMDGTMAAATVANGGVVNGPGASSGAFPTATAGSSTGVAGYYPVTVVGGTGQV